MGVLEGGGSYRLTLKSLFDRLVAPDSKIYPGPGTDYQVRGDVGIARFSEFTSHEKELLFPNPRCDFKVTGTIKDLEAVLAFQYDATTIFPWQGRKDYNFNAAVDQALAEYLLLQQYLTPGTEVELRGRIRNTNPRLLMCSAVRVNFTNGTHFDHGNISSQLFED